VPGSAGGRVPGDRCGEAGPHDRLLRRDQVGAWWTYGSHGRRVTICCRRGELLAVTRAVIEAAEDIRKPGKVERAVTPGLHRFGGSTCRSTMHAVSAWKTPPDPRTSLGCHFVKVVLRGQAGTYVNYMRASPRDQPVFAYQPTSGRDSETLYRGSWRLHLHTSPYSISTRVLPHRPWSLITGTSPQRF
jgi:hypothetical protein